MTRRHTSPDDRRDVRLLDEDAWDAPRRLTHDDLFTWGDDGWRRAGFASDDPEDFR
jgi:hypothetical protein